MKIASFRPESIRNVVLLGAGGAGKTTLAEAVLHRCGNLTRMGTVEAATTASDFEPEARGHHHSVGSTLLYATTGQREINLIDTPGHPELLGAALSALPAVETAVIVLNSASGIDAPTRRCFEAAGEAGLARLLVLNKMDRSPRDLPQLLAEVKAEFGAHVHALDLPSQGGRDVIDCFESDMGRADFGSVEAIHREVLESAVEADDAQLERYLAGEKIDLLALRRTFVKAMAAGLVVPVLFTSAEKGIGIAALVHVLLEEAPSPLTGRAHRVQRGDQVVEVACDPSKPLLAHVFKVTVDAKLGPLAMVRVLQGTIDGATPWVVQGDPRARTAGHLLKVEGRDHPELEAQAFAGDLVALAHVEGLRVGQVLQAPELGGEYAVPALPWPPAAMTFAVEAASPGDDAKLGHALEQLAGEDPTLGLARHAPSWAVSGLGELHLSLALERLKNRTHLAVKVKRH